MATRGVLARLFILGLAVLVVAAPVMAQGAGDLLKQGLDLLKAGKYTEATGMLRKALAADPTSEEVMAALGRAEYEALLALIASGQEGANIAKALLDRAMPILPAKAFNQAELKKLIVEAVTSEDYTGRFDAQMTLARVYGEFAVPGLVDYLASNNTEHKIAAHIALSRRVGRAAVQPLIRALGAKDPGVRRMVAAGLGLIGDERAIPALTELAATDGDPNVQREANGALASLTGKYAYAQGMGASELYTRLAARYYGGDYSVLTYSDRPLVLWSWTNDGLVSSPVPRHLYVLKLAEAAAYRAMAVDSSNGAASALLARVIASEKLASDTIAAVTEDDLSRRYAAGLRDAAGVVAALGSETLTRAIGDAIDDDDHAAAAFLLRVLPRVNASGELTVDNPVVRALDNGAANVRFMSAEAILRFNGTRRITAFPDPADFIGRVAKAAGETIPRQVLVADGMDGRRNKMLKVLDDAGYTAYEARTGSDGVVRALRFSGLDLIVISHDLVDMEALAFISKLGNESRTKAIPIMVVGTAAQAADENWRQLYSGKTRNVAGIPEETGIATEEFLKLISSSFEGDSPSAAAAFRRASEVLDALAMTDTENPLFPWSGLTTTLTQLLTAGNLPADPPVRLNAIRAMGNIGDATAVTDLATFFGTTDDDKLRAAAGMAIAQIAIQGDVSLDDAAYGALLKGTRSGDAGVRNASFAALGACKLLPAQAAKVVNVNRPGVGGGDEGCGDGGGCGDGCGDG